MKKLSLLLMITLIGLFGIFASAEGLQEEVPGATREVAPDATTATSVECAYDDQRCLKNFSPVQLTTESGHAMQARVHKASGAGAEVVKPGSNSPVAE